MKPLIAVNNLELSYGSGKHRQAVVGPLDLDIRQGEALGLIGESGSGKTTLGLELLGLLGEKGGRRDEGGVIATIKPEEIAYIPQDPNASIDPLFSIGNFLKELHADNTAVQEVLRRAKLPLERISLKSYPHELSGGMKQRLVIAAALLRKPKLIIADEPTSSLDVTIQAEMMKLFGEIKNSGMTFLFITHHLPLAACFCDRIAVMSRGKIVEMQATKGLFASPKHEYTRQLISAVPRLKR